MLGSEDKFKSVRNCFKILAGLLGCMNTMVIQDDTDFVGRIILFIQNLEKTNKINAFMRVTDSGDDLACQQINAGQQRYGAQTYIFTVSGNESMGLGRPVPLVSWLGHSFDDWLHGSPG